MFNMQILGKSENSW